MPSPPLRPAIALALGCCLLASPPLRAESFIISDIRVEGLQRISAGTVFAAVPLEVGDLVDAPLLRRAIRGLFATGNFDDIQLGRDGNVLVIVVAERPSISEIAIEGNKAIETEALLEGLKGAGLAEGQVFQRSTLEGMQLELQRQYVQQGRYDARIDTDVIPEPRNRVSVNIEVDEGSVAVIRHINIVGNSIYDDDELRDLFELKTTGWLSWLTSDDKYSREKLTGDLETLTSHYLDRGHLRFRIDSTQVSVTPERDAVYITANVSEGGKYEVSGVDLSGDLVLPEEDLRRLLIVGEGQTYSQQLVTSTEEFLTQRLGNEGYNFAKVTGVPEIDDDDHTVELKFFIEPGKRTYVRRISFRGNTRTEDEVLRREMRQMEGAPASAAAIETSRVRLERLGFFKGASVETPEVPGHDDLIDVEFEVEEQSSGSIGASFGYAQGTGVILGVNVLQDNFLGSGRRVGMGFNSSSYQDYYNLAYTNPYYTEDGVSRGFNIYYRATDLEEINVASYTTDTIGGAVSFGYPIKETERLGFQVGLSNTEITAGRFAVQEIKASPRLQEGVDYWFASQLQADGTYAAPEVPMPVETLAPSQLSPPDVLSFLDLNGDEYLNWSLTSSWIRSTLNRGIHATRGAAQSLALEMAMPGSDLEFYKLTYRGEYYLPLWRAFTLRFRAELGYGDGYGDTSQLPFYEHFFAGGIGSVRGFETNTLGPRSTPAQLYRLRAPVTEIDDAGRPVGGGGPGGDIVGYVERDGKLLVDPVVEFDDPDPFGGNALMEGSIELIFPLPFVNDQRAVRPAVFFDAGNVFNTRCTAVQINCFDIDAGEVRYSVGVGITWLTGFAPMSFSIAKPLNKGEFDEAEPFQFTLGTGF